MVAAANGEKAEGGATTPLLPATPPGLVQQAPSDATTSPTTASKSGGLGLPLITAIPILLIIVTIVIILLLILVWLNYRSKRKLSAPPGYHSIPTQDIGPIMNLPYPTNKPKAKIKMMEPPIPGTTTQFVEATALGDPSSRYPFTTDSSSSSDKDKAKKPARRLSNRRAKPQDVKMRSSVDRFSDGSEDGYSSPKVSASPASRSQAVTPPPSPSLSLKSSRSSITALQEKEEKIIPKLYLVFVYQESEALLTVKVEKATDLPYRADETPVDAYVRLFFIPKLPDLPQRRTSKTDIQRRNNAPVFNEEVQYEAMSMEELINSNLHVEVLDYRSYGKHLVIGQADISLIQVQFVKGEAPVVLNLKPPKMRENLGTILVSICYSPDSKKLGVIILRAKDLNRGNGKDTDAQAKIWITGGGGRVLGRMRTKKKAQSCSPIFNEALNCTMEPSQVKNAAVNIAVLNDSRNASKRELGQVILCGQCSGEEFRHWNDVMATPGKHIAEWHELR